jgi:rSAM/selenodomain-associated transferase 2
MRMSIIIPVLNEALLIRGHLRALQPLRAAGVEVVVVDGGSTDATAALSVGLCDRVLQSPKGRAAQMNFGAQHATGDALLFLHADTQLPARGHELVLQALQDPKAQWGRFDVTITGQARKLRLVAALMNVRSRLSGIATGDQAFFMRRTVWLEQHGFPLQPLMEDIEMSRRLRAQSWPVCLRQRVQTSGRRWEQRGVWRTIVLMWCLRLAYFLGAPADQLARLYR